MQRPTKKRRDVLLRVRLTPEEYAEFSRVARFFRTTPEQLVKDAIRAIIDEYKHLKSRRHEDDCVLYT